MAGLHAQGRGVVTTLELLLLRVILALWMAGGVMCAETARSLYRQARGLEKKGKYQQAWVLANRAVAREPENALYWNYAQALRNRGMEGANLAVAASAAAPDLPSFEALAIPDEELREARELRPPPLLRPLSVVRSFNLRAEAKQLFTDVLKAYGLEVVFDADYQATAPVRFFLDNARFADALRALEAVTGSFAVAVSERVALVARDTAQKRQEIEPVMAVVLPFPESVAVQEVQEAARAVQSTFDMQKLGVDSQRRLILFRDRVSRLRPAMALFQQLMAHRGQVVVDVELLGVSENSTLNYGSNLPTAYNLLYFGSNRLDGSGTLPNVPSGLTGNYLVFGKGNGMFGFALADTQFFAAMTRGSAQSISRTTVRSVEGQAATFHLGDRYPIITQQFAGPGEGQEIPEEAYRPPPTIQFEDLGVVVKLTPWLHGMDEVTLEVNAEYKQLTGESLNDIPVISNRKYESRVRLRLGQTVVVAGLLDESRSRGWRGFPLLGAVAPPLRSNNVDRAQVKLLLSITPRLVSAPPAETATWPVWVGTETRPLTPVDEP